MDRYSVKLRVETIAENTRLTDKQYSSWLAVNVGTAAATIYGFELQPGEGLSSQQIIQTTPADKWEEPIDITVQPGGAIRLSRSLGTPIK